MDHACVEFGEGKFETKFVIFILQILFNAQGVSKFSIRHRTKYLMV